MPINTINDDLPLWFWKLDGKVVSAENKLVARLFIDQGLKQLNQEEVNRFSPGQYNPVFDMRGRDIRTIQVPDDIPEINQSDILEVTVL